MKGILHVVYDSEFNRIGWTFGPVASKWIGWGRDTSRLESPYDSEASAVTGMLRQEIEKEVRG